MVLGEVALVPALKVHIRCLHGGTGGAQMRYTRSLQTERCMNYWVARAGQKQGPLPLAEVQKMLAEGRLAATDLAWGEGMPAWAPVLQVLPPPPPPAAPAYPPTPNYAQPQLYPQPAYPPQPGYGYPTPPPAYPQPAYGAVPTMAAVPGAVPPMLHWGAVLLLAIVTFGLFGLIWLFIQSSFIKRIDPRSSARALFIVVVVLELVYVGILFIAVAGGGRGEDLEFASMVGLFVMPVNGILALVAFFQMRRSMLNYYNMAEPIGLRLSGVMTFFFNIYYLQHQFTRIAEWKKTGVLMPQ